MHSATVLDCRNFFRAGFPLCVLFLLLASCDSEPVVAGGGNSSETSNALSRSVLRSDGSVARGDSITILPELYYADFSISRLKSNQHYEGVLDSNGNLPVLNLADGRYWLEIHSSHSVLGRELRVSRGRKQIDSTNLLQQSWGSWKGYVLQNRNLVEAGTIYILGSKHKASLSDVGRFEFPRISLGAKKIAAYLKSGNKVFYCKKNLMVWKDQISDSLNFDSKDCLENKKSDEKGGKSVHSSLLIPDSIPEVSDFAKLVNP